MRNARPFSLAALMAVGIMVIGCFYLSISRTSLRIIWSKAACIQMICDVGPE